LSVFIAAQNKIQIEHSSKKMNFTKDTAPSNR
jgi:hypothetical protein